MHCIHVSAPPSQVSAPQRAKIIHRKPRYEHSLNFTFFNSLPLIFSLLIFSKNKVSISSRGCLVPFSFSSINLLILFVIMSENTFTQMESPLLRDQSGVPAEQSHKTVTPVSRKQTAVQFSPLCNQISGLCFMEENSHWRLAAYNRFYGCCFRWEAS